jgi:hypothetical protein
VAALQLELYWEVLLINILNFRFVYPTERDLIPRWLIRGADRAAEGAGRRCRRPASRSAAAG